MVSYEKSTSGFQLRGSVGNSGSCEKFLGKIISYDARGSLKLDVTYNEFRMVSKNVTEKIQSGDLLFGNKIKINLPENTKQFTFLIIDINGKQHIISDTKNSEMFDVEYIPKGNYVTIGVKDLKQLF